MSHHQLTAPAENIYATGLPDTTGNFDGSDNDHSPL